MKITTTKKYSKKRGKSKSKSKSTKRETRKMKMKCNKKNKKGGFKNGYICESEGCVFYPSLITNSTDGVTKLYHSEKLYNTEKNSYSLFDSVDPEYKYHSQIFSFGVLNPQEIRDKILQPIRDINYNKSYFYIDMEYAGKNIGNIDQIDNNLAFQTSFLQFIINVLNLQTQGSQSQYLVHGDPHPGNICYKKDSHGNYIVKYIDITNVGLVNPDTIIASGTDITRQFSSLMGATRIIFGFVNKITDQLLPIVMSAPGRKYSDVVHDIVDTLNNIHLDTNINDSSSFEPIPTPALASAASPLPNLYSPLPKNKRLGPLFTPDTSSSTSSKKYKTKLFDETPYKMPTLNFDDDDDNDNV